MKTAVDDVLASLSATKFGKARMLRVIKHQRDIREFRERQAELAGVAILQLSVWIISSASWVIVFLCVFFLVSGVGRDEARRFRACGRQHQCKRSLEVIGI